MTWVTPSEARERFLFRDWRAGDDLGCAPGVFVFGSDKLFFDTERREWPSRSGGAWKPDRGEGIVHLGNNVPTSGLRLLLVRRRERSARWGHDSDVCVQYPAQVAIPQGASPGVHTLTVTVNGTVELTGEITVTPRNLAAFTWSPDPNNPQNLSSQITNPSGQLVGNPALSSSYVQASSGDVLTLTGTGAGTTAPVLNDNTVSPPPGTAVCNFGPSVNFDESTYSPVVSCRRQAGSFSIDTIQFTVPNGLASGPHSIIVEGSYGSVVYKNAVWLK
jgi:uncharacterized protein (TIGR03437 family)